MDSEEEDLVTGGTAVLVGIAAWEYTSTRKNATPGRQNYDLFSRNRFGDAISHTFGANVAAATGLPYDTSGAKFLPMGWANKVTALGIIALVVDAGLRKYVKGYEDDMDGLPQFVKGAGIGLTAGGIVGGITDPAPAGYSRQTPQVGTSQFVAPGLNAGT